MAALLSLLRNKHGQKSVKLIQVVLKNIKKQKRKKWQRTKLQLSQETLKLLFYSGSEVQRRHFSGTCKRTEYQKSMLLQTEMYVTMRIDLV